VEEKAPVAVAPSGMWGAAWTLWIVGAADVVVGEGLAEADTDGTKAATVKSATTGANRDMRLKPLMAALRERQQSV
jgi:hypothetical protein